MSTTLFKNCKIYDGIVEPYMGKIFIDDDKIKAVGKSDFFAKSRLAENIAIDKTYDMKGLSVSSGFIDAHSHNDWFAIKNEPIKYFEPFIRQGITSCIAGNCGLSSVGFEKNSEHIEKNGAGLFFYDDTTGKYGTIDEFYGAIDKNMPINLATLVGHCTARTSVAGYQNTPLSLEDETKMLNILENALKCGAVGISLGLMYEPGIYANEVELRKIAKLCEKYNKPLTVHPRACSAVSMAYPNPFGRPHIMLAIDELKRITAGLKVKLQYSHAIFVGKNTFKCHTEFLETIAELNKNGIDAKFDIYSELCGVSIITVVMPVWYQALSPQKKKSFGNLLKFKALAVISKKLLGFSFEDMIIAYLGEKGKQYEGKSVAQIAKEMKKSELDTYIYLCELSNFKGRINMYQYSTPEIVSKLAKSEYSMFMTDAWVEENGVQNMAIYDCFPKFLHLSLNNSGDTMTNTLKKMTSTVATRFQLLNRGCIKEDYYADLTFFDETELKNGTPDQMKSFGIKNVVINGKIVLENDKLNYDVLKTSGRVMK